MVLVRILLYLTLLTIWQGLIFWTAVLMDDNPYNKELLLTVQKFFLLTTVALELIASILLAFLAGRSHS